MAVRRKSPKRNIMQTPVNDQLLEMIVNEADRQDVSMAAFVRSVVTEWFEKNVVAAE